MSKHFQQHIDKLKQQILEVGSLVETAISQAVVALMRRDARLASAVIDADDEIDRMEVDVEEEVLEILTLFQPVAADLRFVVAALKINNDLERMGDLARNIARRAVFLATHGHLELPDEVAPMAEEVQTMVRQSLEALVQGDVHLARKVCAADDDVDAMRTSIQDQIEHQISQHPDRTEGLVRLISVSRHLERLADMATNIAEDVIYMVEGDIVRHKHTV